MVGLFEAIGALVIWVFKGFKNFEEIAPESPDYGVAFFGLFVVAAILLGLPAALALFGGE